jgi:hypothetical protein
MTARKALLPAGVLIALPTILYAPFLFGGKVLYWGVYLLQFYPWRQLAVEQIRAGHWPLWNPYLGAGTPLAANLQTAAFYPLNVLFLLMPVERAFGWELALHVALAGLFAYYLARTLGLSRFGALVCGLAYGGGGYIIARWVFPTMVCAAAWLPLLLALTERLISNLHYPLSDIQQHRYWIVDIGLLALVVALQLLAGHAQTSFYSLLIVAAFALFRLVQRQVARGKLQVRQILLAAGCLLIALLWGIALAAIQLLPTAELAAHSQRAGRLTNLQFAYELSFWPWRLITLLAPDFFGNPARSNYWAYGTYWEEAAFVGVLPLIFAALAGVAWWQKRKTADKGPLALVPFLTPLAIISVLLALGEHTPIYPLLFRCLPGFGLFQAPARLMIGYALAIPLLAGIGADALRLTYRSRTALRILIMVGLGSTIAGSAAWLALPTIRPSFSASIFRLGLTLALAGGILLLRDRRFRGLRWQSVIVIFVAADLLVFGWGLAPGTDAAVYRAPVSSAGFLQYQAPGRILVAPSYAQGMYEQYVSSRSFGSTDPSSLQDFRESLMPNLNAAYDLPGIGIYDPLTIGLYRDLYDLMQVAGDGSPKAWTPEEQRLADLFGVRYIVTDEELPLLQVSEGDPRIYLNDTALPEAYVVFRARVIKDEAEQIEALLDPGFDPHSEVILSASAQPGEGTTGETTSQPTPLVLRQGPDRVIIQVEMEQAGFLVLTDTCYPGWRAMVDGEPAEILAANHAFRTVALRAGEHTVVFRYAPLSFRLGAWITLGAGLLLGLMFVFGRAGTSKQVLGDR